MIVMDVFVDIPGGIFYDKLTLNIRKVVCLKLSANICFFVVGTLFN